MWLITRSKQEIPLWTHLWPTDVDSQTYQPNINPHIISQCVVLWLKLSSLWQNRHRDFDGLGEIKSRRKARMRDGSEKPHTCCSHFLWVCICIAHIASVGCLVYCIDVHVPTALKNYLMWQSFALCMICYSTNYKVRNLCVTVPLSVLCISWKHFTWSASHLVGVLLGTQGCAVSNLVQFGQGTC